MSKMIAGHYFVKKLPRTALSITAVTMELLDAGTALNCTAQRSATSSSLHLAAVADSTLSTR